MPTAKKTPKPTYPKRLKDKVAIVGFADGHRDHAPFKDPTFEIWGLNRLHNVMPDKKWDRWFEIHDLHMYDDEPDHMAFLHDFKGPVYIRPQDYGYFDIPNAVPLPFGQIAEDFHPYFTNSVSYELAMAIGMGFKEIHVYGVDMAQDNILEAEYAFQRPSCEFFLGVAVGRGIKLFLPSGCDLLVTSHLYGLEDVGPIRGKQEARFQELGQRKEELKRRISQFNAEVSQMSAHVNQLDGAMQQVQYELRNLSPVREEGEKI